MTYNFLYSPELKVVFAIFVTLEYAKNIELNIKIK